MQRIYTWIHSLLVERNPFVMATCCIVYCATSATAFADDLPLTIEDLFTDERSFRFEMSGIYSSRDTSNVQTQFQTIEVGQGQFIDVPIEIGEARQNVDIFVLSLGLRYGLSAKTELFGRISGVVSETRIDPTDGDASSSGDQRFSDLTAGVNHQFLDDDKTPALLGFAELSLVENTSASGIDAVFLKSGTIGLTTYRSIDPIVLSLTSGYRYTAKREASGLDIDPGDLLFLAPNVAFAVNNEVTLTGGVQFRFRGKDEVEGTTQGIRTSSTELELGLGYAPVDRWSVRFDVGADISGDTGAEAGLNLLYKFGD